MPYNENYVHICESNKVDIHKYHKSITCIYSERKLVDVLDFYLFHPLILKDEKQNARFDQKCLKEYGWFGTRGRNSLSCLEGKLLRCAEIGSFCILKSDKITETATSLGLDGDRICVEHPRAIMKQLSEITLLENGQIRINDKEKRLVCLFRHIRNSIAHNCTYLFENGNVMFDDYEDDDLKNLTARIIMNQNTLVEWIKIICNENDDNQNE